MNQFYRRSVLLCRLTVFVVITVSVRAQYKSGIEANKTEDTTPVAIRSRFVDLGGVISQLFTGFNQGSGGGSGASGPNLPTNSQFYPGVPAQNGITLPPGNQGNGWSFPNQGNLNGGSQNQQPWNQLNPNLINSNINVPNQNQGWNNVRPNFNNQLNNNQNPSQGFQGQGSKFNVRLTTVSPYPKQGNNRSNNRNKPRRNEGTLEDFFKTKSSTGSRTRDEDSAESTGKVALWGQKVLVPTTTPSNNIVFLDSTESPSQKQCVQNCPTTSEYKPVCGTDEVTYFNEGRLICARNCGINVFQARQGSCKARG